LRACENRVLRKIFRLEKAEVSGGWREFHEEIYKLYSSDIIRMMKSRSILSHIGAMRGA
jgi:hypothetical protein